MHLLQKRNPSDLPALREKVERFLATALRPAVIEPGEPLLILERDSYSLEERAPHLALQAWDRTRNLVRRISGVEREQHGKLSLAVQRFGGRTGELHLVDLGHPRTQDWEKRGTRMVFRERFRRMLEREFPGWRLSELSSEADLQHSLSPAYPRAILTRGASAIAAIAAPPECTNFPAMLTFGLIWLDYVRKRDVKRSVAALTFWAPAPVAPLLSFYLPHLNGSRAQLSMYLYSDEDFAVLLDPQDYGNVATELDPCRRETELPFSVDHAELVPAADGATSLRIAGLEFARFENGELRNGRDKVTLGEARANAESLHSLRNPHAPHNTLIYSQNPEAWLESQVRSDLAAIDASLVMSPVYGQVPAIAAQTRTVLDLLAVDHTGRLAVLELKAAQDLQLPLQALDYWIRVRWHLDRGEFTRFGYFPGMELRRDPPRLLLIAPSLDFHPSTETILQYFSPDVEVTRIGLTTDWRLQLRVMFRLSGADRPHD